MGVPHCNLQAMYAPCSSGRCLSDELACLWPTESISKKQLCYILPEGNILSLLQVFETTVMHFR